MLLVNLIPHPKALSWLFFFPHSRFDSRPLRQIWWSVFSIVAVYVFFLLHHFLSNLLRSRLLYLRSKYPCSSLLKSSFPFTNSIYLPSLLTYFLVLLVRITSFQKNRTQKNSFCYFSFNDRKKIVDYNQ